MKNEQVIINGTSVSVGSPADILNRYGITMEGPFEDRSLTYNGKKIYRPKLKYLYLVVLREFGLDIQELMDLPETIK